MLLDRLDRHHGPVLPWVSRAKLAGLHEAEAIRSMFHRPGELFADFMMEWDEEVWKSSRQSLPQCSEQKLHRSLGNAGKAEVTSRSLERTKAVGIPARHLNTTLGKNAIDEVMSWLYKQSQCAELQLNVFDVLIDCDPHRPQKAATAGHAIMATHEQRCELQSYPLHDPAGHLIRRSSVEVPPWGQSGVPRSGWTEFTKPIIRPQAVDSPGVHRVSRFIWDNYCLQDGLYDCGMLSHPFQESQSLLSQGATCRVSTSEGMEYHMTRNHIGGFRGTCGSWQMAFWELGPMGIVYSIVFLVGMIISARFLLLPSKANAAQNKEGRNSNAWCQSCGMRCNSIRRWIPRSASGVTHKHKT